MSSDSPTSKSATGFLWVLGAMASFALLSMLAQAFYGQDRVTDPRMEERLKNLDETKGAQLANVKKMGLEVGGSSERLAKSLEVLKTMKPSTSTVVVPGSPTQLKQAAAAPAPAAAAAPATAPAPAK